MTGKELHRASRFGSLIKTDQVVREAFVKDPVRALADHAGVTLTKEEAGALTNYVTAAKALEKAIGYQDPPSQAKIRAPWWMFYPATGPFWDLMHGFD
jgi:hypothetical protein